MIFNFHREHTNGSLDNDHRLTVKNGEQGHLHEYVFMENDIFFKGNAAIVLCLHVVFISFSATYTKTMKTIENSENQRKSIVCPSR